MMCKKYDLTNVENPSDLKKIIMAYGLTYADIAKRSGYVESTIYNMMNGVRSTRSENYMIIRRTILNMIEETGLDGNPYGVDCIRAIQIYLRESGITRDEFADMCGISHNWLYGAYVEKRKEISPSVVSKILKVTGWTSDQLRSGKLRDFKSEDKEEEVETCDILTPEVPKGYFGSSVTALSPTTEESKNQQYRVDIDEDGTKHYICEYDLVQTTHVTRELTREQFIQEV